MSKTDEAMAGGLGSTLVVRLKIKNVPGMLAKVAASIGDSGGNIGAIDTPEITSSVITRDITIFAPDDERRKRIAEAR